MMERMKGQTERTGNPEFSHQWATSAPGAGRTDRENVKIPGPGSRTTEDAKGTTEWLPLWEMSPSAGERAESPDFSFLVPSGPPTGCIHMRAVSKGAWGQAQCPWYRAEDGEDRGQRLLRAGYGTLAVSPASSATEWLPWWLRW